jgi:hypothetical protein
LDDAARQQTQREAAKQRAKQEQEAQRLTELEEWAAKQEAAKQKQEAAKRARRSAGQRERWQEISLSRRSRWRAGLAEQDRDR